MSWIYPFKELITPGRKVTIAYKLLELIGFFSALNGMIHLISDHRPILLESGDWDATPSYFKFENMWLQFEGFVDKLKNWWQSYNFSGRADFILLQKLKSLKKDITRWNKEEFGKVETRKTTALDELMALEQMTEGRQLTLIESNQMMSLRVELQQLAKAEEISWR